MSETLSLETAAQLNWPQGATMKEYSGSCHCKKIQFKFEHPVFDDGSMGVIQCNCSICVEKGLVVTRTPEDRFRFTSGGVGEMTEYRFGAGNWPHYFCPVCGVETIVKGQGMVTVNLRTVEGVEVEKLKINHFDGKNLL